MRISDWSSDVCSSDLHPARWHERSGARRAARPDARAAPVVTRTDPPGGGRVGSSGVDPVAAGIEPGALSGLLQSLVVEGLAPRTLVRARAVQVDRKSTRLNSSH